MTNGSPGPINNAKLNTISAYYELRPAFQALLRAQGRRPGKILRQPSPPWENCRWKNATKPCEAYLKGAGPWINLIDKRRATAAKLQPCNLYLQGLFTWCATTSTPIKSFPRSTLNLIPTIPDEYEKLGSFALAGLPDSLYPATLRQARRARQRVSDCHWRAQFRLRQFARTRAHCARLGRCKAVVAESFARIFFRNSVATGELYPCECADRLCDELKTGDVVTVDLDKETFTVQASGKVHLLKPLGDVRPVVDAGGLFNYARKTGMMPGLTRPDLPGGTQRSATAPRQKTAFEICQYFRQRTAASGSARTTGRPRTRFHLREIIRVVRAQINRAARNQRRRAPARGKRSLISRCLRCFRFGQGSGK